jgi:AraC-like DNA-binding protein
MKRDTDIRIDDHAGRGAPIFAERAPHFTDDHRHPPNTSVTHDFAALAFYVGGGARIELRETWTLERGDVLIVPAGEPHRLIEARNPDMWRLGFCVPCLATEAAAAAVLLEPFERVRDGASPVVRIPPDRRDFLESLFREFSMTGDSATEENLVRRSLLTLIINEVARASASTPASFRTAAAGGGTVARSLVSDTLRYIERHCLEPLTLTAIAAAMKRTPSYITTALTRATGRSAVAWIIAGRMAEARRRLLHSDERIDIIAERVGYADPTHFIRLFRRTHGATPAGWRALQREGIGAPATTAARATRERRRRSPARG